MNRRKLPEPAVFGFLLPNFLGFCLFMLFPIVLSLVMSLTNWTLRPQVKLEYLGLRNFTDLLGVRSLGAGGGTLAIGYEAAAVALFVGLAGALWANVSAWRGFKIGGAILAALGLGVLAQKAAAVAMLAGGGEPVLTVGGLRLAMGGGAGLTIAGAIALLGGLGILRREDGDWRPGPGMFPAALLAAAVVALWLLNRPMWTAHEPTDTRFWQFFHNTLFLMLGIPFSIAGSLGLALLLSDTLPMGPWRRRLAGTALCLACGGLTLCIVWSLGWPNLAVLGAIFWAMAAIGMAANVSAFRTLFYLPTFTAGVALMVLWKALYNPQTGPINAGLAGIYQAFGFGAEAIEAMLPRWLASVTWAKPALILMGVWTAIGGTDMLLYLAGLSNVPQTLLDAALVDGAGRWARFRHVIWPQLAPTTFFITIMSVIGGLQGGFEQARVMTQGGPAGATTTLSYYIYNKFFQDLDLGYAAAISWVLFALIFVATAINWRFGRKLEVVE